VLEQHARVVTTSQDAVWVEAIEPSGCGTCGGSGCSTRQIAELFQRGPRHFRVDSAFDLKPGERVVVGVPDGSVLKIAFRMYGLPWLMILAGALFAHGLAPGDGIAVLGALAGAVLAWLWNRGGPSLRPVVVRRDDADVFTLTKGN
jgi:sigma-E factor negative regulatory protein RseC